MTTTDPNTLRRWLARCIWIDPVRRGGEPCLGGTGVTVESLLTYIDFGLDADVPLRDEYPQITGAHVAVAEWWQAQEAARDAELVELRAKVARVEEEAEWFADREREMAARTPRGDPYYEGARDAYDIAESRLRAALAGDPDE